MLLRKIILRRRLDRLPAAEKIDTLIWVKYNLGGNAKEDLSAEEDTP